MRRIIACTIADMALSRADGSQDRFYSMSLAIEAKRKEYYSKNDIAPASITAVRHLLIAILLPALAYSAEATFPHWDGSESIEQYAKRANLPPTKTLDLGDGVKLELVLIPAGTFVMGTPEPEPVDVAGYRNKIQTGQVIFGFGGGALLVLLVMVLVQAIRKRQRPQYSLAWFLAMTVAAGIGLLGGLHWYFSARARADARSEYQAALARYVSSERDEKPAHEVTLTQPFYMGKYEVTQEQYMPVLGRLLELTQEEYDSFNFSKFKGRDRPMDWIGYDEASEFCAQVSKETSSVVRLPTEAEWERACRAGTKTKYYTGDAETDLDRAGWYDMNSKGTTHPVGQKVPRPGASMTCTAMSGSFVRKGTGRTRQRRLWTRKTAMPRFAAGRGTAVPVTAGLPPAAI